MSKCPIEAVYSKASPVVFCTAATCSLMFSRCYYFNFLIHLVVTYVAVWKPVVSQARTSSWSQRWLWCFFFCSQPSTTHQSFTILPPYDHVYLYCLFFFCDRWFSINTQGRSHAPCSYLLFLHCQRLSLLAPSSLSLSGHSCIWLWKREFHRWTLLLAIAKRLVYFV